MAFLTDKDLFLTVNWWGFFFRGVLYSIIQCYTVLNSIIQQQDPSYWLQVALRIKKTSFLFTRFWT